ncbi:MAG: hypothetical protein IID17_08505 [Nitrospinae bacterium]|nr:hypothetical protein [Nitrospinota bacterium]
MTLLNWGEYLTHPGEAALSKCRENCSNSFINQRNRIRDLYSALSPKNVVCIGSGYLNDIPIEDFVKAGSTIYLVDWVKDLSQLAYCKDVITECKGRYQCFICQTKYDPRQYCTNYQELDVSPKEHKQDVCSSFIKSNISPSLCENFEFGTNPVFIDMDATQGRADVFARRVSEMISRAKTPKAVFKNALREVGRLKQYSTCFPIDGQSVDFVTSSMVVSQFEFEPYGFMAKKMAQKFGTNEINRMEKILTPYMEKLRSILFPLLVEGHFEEMHRILQTDGRVYFSIETFHRPKDYDRWFWCKNLDRIMEIISKYFWFDFETLPELGNPDRMDILEGKSIVSSYVLVPKSRTDL